MGEIGVLRSDIDSKLSREKNNLSMLKDAMNKSNTNTQNMLTILNSFENRLKKLESTVEPVYNETEMLRRRQENIDKTLFTLDNVLGYFHVAKEVEANIIEGPSVGGLDKYLGHMDRLLEAHNYFNTHNPASLDLTDVMRVYDEGKDILQREFRTMLSRHGRPVPPVMILDLIGSDEELQHDEPDVLEHLPEKVVSDLGEIAKWLITKGNTTEFLKDYQKLRADMLHRSLQGLKEHMKSSSCSSASSGLFPGQQSPAPIGKFRGTKDTPVRKSMKKIAHNFKKKASSALLQSPFDPGHKRQGSYTDSLKDEIFDVEEDILITELSALLKLMQSEIQLMSGIIPEKHHRTVFDGIVQPGLDTVVTEGELLATNAKKNIGRHEFTAVLSIFPVVKHLRTIKPEFDFTLEGCQVPTRAKLASLLSVLGSTGAKALEEFIDSIKNDPERASMPRDGTVHELTNHAIIFIEPLQDYADTAGAMLLMHGEQAAPSDAVDIKKCKLKLADYITKVLSALGLNLNNKCETYNDPTLRHVFMLNNLNYIQKSLKRSGLIELIHSWNKDVCQYYDDQILEQKRFYSQSWSKVLHYILDVNEPMSIQRTQGTEPVKLKEKQKQNIKDKFTGFNKELEEITRIQKGYAIPDPELRDGLKKDNIDYIVPTYKIFLEKYKKLNFTKNQDKYIKYTAENVEHMINNLFDTSA